MNEAQARPMSALEPEFRQEAWQTSLALAGDKPVTAKLVEAGVAATRTAHKLLPSRFAKPATAKAALRTVPVVKETENVTAPNAVAADEASERTVQPDTLAHQSDHAGSPVSTTLPTASAELSAETPEDPRTDPDRVSLAVLKTDAAWLRENSLELDGAFVDLRRLREIAIVLPDEEDDLLNSITRDYNGRNPSQPMSREQRVSMLVVDLAKEWKVGRYADYSE